MNPRQNGNETTEQNEAKENRKKRPPNLLSVLNHSVAVHFGHDHEVAIFAILTIAQQNKII
jgi:hypothetical protein